MQKDSQSYKEIQLKELKYSFFYTIFLTISALVEMFFNVFLLYMTIRFARVNKNAEQQDPILGRKVPSLVFLQN